MDSSRDSNISSATLNQKKKKPQINVIQEFIMNMSKTPHTHTQKEGRKRRLPERKEELEEAKPVIRKKEKRKK